MESEAFALAIGAQSQVSKGALRVLIRINLLTVVALVFEAPEFCCTSPLQICQVCCDYHESSPRY